MNINNLNPISRKSNIVVQEFENEVLIYDLIINKAFCLNETSTLIWQLLDGKHSIADISHNLSRQLKMPITEDLVWLALDQFKRDKLLEQNDELRIEFGGLNRRQAIRKVGLASLVMLPIISSIVAPTSAMAQSGGIALFGACPSGSGCAAGLNCKSCFNGSCNGSPTCCANSSSINTTGNGFIATCVFSQPECDSSASQLCCSGIGTLSGSQVGCGGGRFQCNCSS